MSPAYKENSYPLGGPGTTAPHGRPQKTVKFFWERPPNPRLNSMAQYFVTQKNSSTP